MKTWEVDTLVSWPRSSFKNSKPWHWLKPTLKSPSIPLYSTWIPQSKRNGICEQKLRLRFNYLSTGILTAPQLKPVKAARCHGAQGRNLQSLFLRPKVFITNCGIRVKSNEKEAVQKFATAMKINESEAGEVYKSALKIMSADGTIPRSLQVKMIAFQRRSLKIEREVAPEQVYDFGMIRALNDEMRKSK
jgi:hypothetical protein